MKRKILSVILSVVTILTLMTVSASACRQGPVWDGGSFEEENAGEISIGDNDITITDNECKIFNFTPKYDGFYELTYSDHGCCFIKDEGGFYEYILTCYTIDDINYTTEIYKFTADKTYRLYVANESTHNAYFMDGIKGTKKTSAVKLGYLGQMTDFEITQKDNPLICNSDWNAVTLREGECEPAKYIYTGFNITFEDGSTFYDGGLYGTACATVPLEIIGNFIPQEGENTLTINLMGFEKDFIITVNYPEPEEEDDDNEIFTQPPERNMSLSFKLASYIRAAVNPVKTIISAIKNAVEKLIFAFQN